MRCYHTASDAQYGGNQPYELPSVDGTKAQLPRSHPCLPSSPPRSRISSTRRGTSEKSGGFEQPRPTPISLDHVSASAHPRLSDSDETSPREDEKMAGGKLSAPTSFRSYQDSQSMDSKPKQSKRRQDALSTLNVLIEGLNLAQNLSSVTPVKAVFSTVSIILTMIRVIFHHEGPL